MVSVDQKKLTQAQEVASAIIKKIHEFNALPPPCDPANIEGIIIIFILPTHCTAMFHGDISIKKALMSLDGTKQQLIRHSRRGRVIPVG